MSTPKQVELVRAGGKSPLFNRIVAAGDPKLRQRTSAAIARETR
jgi:hypothetical protein